MDFTWLTGSLGQEKLIRNLEYDAFSVVMVKGQVIYGLPLFYNDTEGTVNN